MTEIFGVPVTLILGQLMLGLVNGSFYALLSLGLAVIFGLVGIVNFAHGAFYALGAFAALLGMQWFGLNYWAALVVAPFVVGLLGVLCERIRPPSRSCEDWSSCAPSSRSRLTSRPWVPR